MSVNGNIVLSYFDSIIYDDDLKLLDGPFWLNDTLIGFYMEYLEKEAYSNLDVCYIRPELTQCIKLSPEINIFLDPIDFNHKKYALMSLNDCSDPDRPGGTHWSLLVFCRDDMKFYHIDSGEGSNREVARLLAAKLSKYIANNIKCEFQALRSLQQNNSYDCGVYLMCNLENVLNHIVKKRNLSTLEPVSETKVSTKREEVKKLIINIHMRELSKVTRK